MLPGFDCAPSVTNVWGRLRSRCPTAVAVTGGAAVSTVSLVYVVELTNGPDT